jgi:uncharacterized protein RhaS with RHS repeats
MFNATPQGYLAPYPLAGPGGLNLYAYMQNRGNNAVDPYGLEVATAAVGAVAFAGKVSKHVFCRLREQSPKTFGTLSPV